MDAAYIDETTGEIALGFDTTQLQDFGDFVNAGLNELSKRDRSTWALGDIAAALEIREGRPSDRDETIPTLKDLAHEWGAAPSSVSEWRNNALFYPNNLRHVVSSWRDGNVIRKYVEFECVGQDYETKFERALEINEEAQALKHRGIGLELWLKDKRRVIQNDVPIPAGHYNVIYADPPWQYDNTGLNGAAEDHYSTMPVEEIYNLLEAKQFGVADNAVLFLWATNPLLPEAFELINRWGFVYKTNLVWVKTDLKKPGVGWYVRGRHELLLIATRGNFTPLDQHISPPIGSVLEAPIQEHSRKPDDIYRIIERLYPDCAFLELFARRERKGWTSWGNEV